MRICHSCRASFPDNLAICPYCGAIAQQANVPARQFQPKKESVSVGGWIGRSLIPFIPLVGGIIYLIMLFIWSGDTKKEDTFRNWAKAQLIVMAIVVVLGIVLAVLFGVVFSDMLSYYY